MKAWDRFPDWPPVWLAVALALAWAQKTWVPVASFGPVWADLLGGLLVGAGGILAALAVFEMRRHRTTFIPHRHPDRLVTTGIFSRSRHPIYLGDVLILTGMILYWDAVLALILIPLFVWILERRFVEPEERRLRHRFPRDWIHYEKKTRRWL
ncbi:methyltransferase family protein [Sagittula salina]|uniref:Isoprenylcysteine carboxylmethyltransferase family protein n=1 Tax=Sagittula salina TaxID=2820268 RepID=A0A940MHR3_9RHOB|nr:isoprenylcysteine carboxylmethyltransferase family protein [Sagittula salina]MBP0481736.1 isoprenylcysteine carboxylmethyltransferase family protein [Sagittula salina]